MLIWVLAGATVLAGWMFDRSPDSRRRQWARPARMLAAGIAAFALLGQMMPDAPVNLIVVPILLASWLYRVPSESPHRMLVTAGKLWTTVLALLILVNETTASVPLLPLFVGPAIVVLMFIAAPLTTMVGISRWAKGREVSAK
ncbi:hypothetical protein GS504_01340 [Rhodococcus hoagii]|nr:hypothetical protein [Prescottella equi]NKS71683.1 hypothetical protein [Prescottella equi]